MLWILFGAFKYVLVANALSVLSQVAEARAGVTKMLVKDEEAEKKAWLMLLLGRR